MQLRQHFNNNRATEEGEVLTCYSHLTITVSLSDVRVVVFRASDGSLAGKQRSQFRGIINNLLFAFLRI